MAAGILDDAAAISSEVTEPRHSIHAEPEIGLDLPETQRKVLEALDGLPLEITCGQSLSSLTAVLRGGQPGKHPGRTVLLRGDRDALPVTERTGFPMSLRCRARCTRAAMTRAAPAFGRLTEGGLSRRPRRLPRCPG